MFSKIKSLLYTNEISQKLKQLVANNKSYPYLFLVLIQKLSQINIQHSKRKINKSSTLTSYLRNKVNLVGSQFSALIKWFAKLNFKKIIKPTLRLQERSSDLFDYSLLTSYLYQRLCIRYLEKTRKSFASTCRKKPSQELKKLCNL